MATARKGIKLPEELLRVAAVRGALGWGLLGLGLPVGLPLILTLRSVRWVTLTLTLALAFVYGGVLDCHGVLLLPQLYIVYGPKPLSQLRAAPV